MSEIIQWPVGVLTPQQASADLVPFSRSGGRTLGGIEPSTRTDLGFWSVTYSGIVMQNRDRRAWQTWSAIRQKLGGRPGLIAVRVSLVAVGSVRLRQIRAGYRDGPQRRQPV